MRWLKWKVESEWEKKTRKVLISWKLFFTCWWHQNFTFHFFLSKNENKKKITYFIYLLHSHSTVYYTFFNSFARFFFATIIHETYKARNLKWNVHIYSKFLADEDFWYYQYNVIHIKLDEGKINSSMLCHQRQSFVVFIWNVVEGYGEKCRKYKNTLLS